MEDSVLKKGSTVTFKWDGEELTGTVIGIRNSLYIVRLGYDTYDVPYDKIINK